MVPAGKDGYGRKERTFLKEWNPVRIQKERSRNVGPKSGRCRISASNKVNIP